MSANQASSNVQGGGMRRRLLSGAARLWRNDRGNAMIFVAVGLIPMTLAIGSGVDLSRAYMARAKLQQAVDAASLAGRKTAQVKSTSAADAEARRYVEFNFPEGVYGAEKAVVTTHQPADTEYCVKATSKVPTAILKSSAGITVGAESCSKWALNNLDLVIVLDVTGSMSAMAGTKTRIEGARDAVLAVADVFDKARVDLARWGLRVRLAVVPYSQTVNIGHLLYDENANYIKTDTSYGYYSLNTRADKGSSSENWTHKPNGSATSRGEEFQTITLSPAALQAYVADGRADRTTVNNGYAWRGCLEARQKVVSGNDTGQNQGIGSSTTTIPNDAADILDVEPGKPMPNSVNALGWRPFMALPDSGNNYGPPTSGPSVGKATWATVTTATDAKNFTGGAPGNETMIRYRVRNTKSATPPWSTTQASKSTTSAGPNRGCPAEAKLLSEANTKAALTSYVTTLQPNGSTLHDSGMYWGISVISPSAPFSNPTKYNGQDVRKFMIFMTDGEMNADEGGYTLYGREDRELRVQTSRNGGAADDEHTKRFDLMCAYAKANGIDISTVIFGLPMTTSMRNCASKPEQAYEVTTSDELTERFRKIAEDIGYLRLTL